MKRVTASFLLATVALVGAQFACAQDTPIRITVSYADLDLSTAKGVKVFYGRLQAASQKVCEPLARLDQNQALIGRHEACVNTAMSDAVKTADNRLLTEYYVERTGGSATLAMARIK